MLVDNFCFCMVQQSIFVEQYTYLLYIERFNYDWIKLSTLLNLSYSFWNILFLKTSQIFFGNNLCLDKFLTCDNNLKEAIKNCYKHC